MPLYYTICVDSAHTKLVKNACEAGDILNTDVKIRKVPQSDASSRCVVPTSVVCERNCDTETQGKALSDDDQLPQQLRLIAGDLRSKSIQFVIGLVSFVSSYAVGGQHQASSPLLLAMKAALARVSDVDPQHVSKWHDTTLRSLAKSYYVYAPMLLLPPMWQTDEICQDFLSSLNDTGQDMSHNRPYVYHLFFSELSTRLGVTHVAINAPIPATTGTYAAENIIRSPSKLTPLFGDFGPTLPPFPEHYPSAKDFSNAFWVTTQQNGITQVWAPRYTMFSAGNVSEKIRMARLPSVHSAVNHGIQAARGCSAVDLFAGIGYFAFSYAKAGVSKILCWDLNPWSVEGFRRGANANRWSSRIFDTDNVMETGPVISSSLMDDSVKFVVFRESNVLARRRIRDLRSLMPPIRHVNCGMLPSVGEAWKIAVEAIDAILGGWIHLHETVSDNKLEDRTTEILKSVSEHLVSLQTRARWPPHAELVHVEKVKSMGPRLSHVVLDIWIPPMEDAA